MKMVMTGIKYSCIKKILNKFIKALGEAVDYVKNGVNADFDFDGI
jgi:hypothetical protein